MIRSSSLFPQLNAAVAGAARILSLALCLGLPAIAVTPVRTIGPGSPGGDIQKALEEVSGNGEVLLAPGTYVVRQPIVLERDNEVLRGSGTNTILRLADNANCPVIILGAAFNLKPKVVSHLGLFDLVIDGNRRHQTVELWRLAADGSQINNNGVDIRGVADATVERVACGHCRSGGLVVSEGTRRLTVHDFASFDNQFDGLACYLTEDSRFSGLYLHDNLAAGISLDLGFNHNLVEQAELDANDLGIFMRDSRKNSFAGVTVRKSHKHGIFVAQATVPTPKGWEFAPGTECTGNRFTDVQMTQCGGQGFLINDVSCTNNYVAGLRLLEETPLKVHSSLDADRAQWLYSRRWVEMENPQRAPSVTPPGALARLVDAQRPASK